MDTSHYTPNRHHLQLSMPQLRKICHDLYQKVAPDELVHRKNVEQCKVSDVSVLTLMLFQAEIGMKSQRRFYQLIRNFFGFTGLERSRFYRRVRYLTPLLRLIRLYFNQLDFDELVIIDSFPVLLCQPVRNHRAKVLNEVANIGYCASKNMYFYGLKVHLAATESGYILDYLVTPASVHDIQAAEELLDMIPYSTVLADLGYLGKELKERLEAKGIHLWTPLRKNMEGAAEHNNPAILAIRRTIETRISVLNAMFDIEHPLARSLAGLQLEIERAILSYNLEFFIN